MIFVEFLVLVVQKCTTSEAVLVLLRFKTMKGHPAELTNPSCQSWESLRIKLQQTAKNVNLTQTEVEKNSLITAKINVLNGYVHMAKDR